MCLAVLVGPNQKLEGNFPWCRQVVVCSRMDRVKEVLAGLVEWKGGHPSGLSDAASPHVPYVYSPVLYCPLVSCENEEF